MEKSWEFHDVAVVVRDMDKAVEYYQSLGIGTFQPEVVVKSSDFADYEVYGKTPNTINKIRVRVLEIGSFQLELIQPVEGESVFKEFLKSKGEGVQHIGFFVDDFDKEAAKLVEKGFPVISSGKINGCVWAFFDTSKVGNFMIELIQL